MFLNVSKGFIKTKKIKRERGGFDCLTILCSQATMIMTKTIEKNETEKEIEAGINSKGSIEEYLVSTYGQKRLDESKQDRSYTHLDVIGYTTDKSGYEMQDRNVNGYGDEYGYRDYYELDDIEDMMVEKWDDKNVGSEDE